jgi:hypothetical protein
MVPPVGGDLTQPVEQQRATGQATPPGEYLSPDGANHDPARIGALAASPLALYSKRVTHANIQAELGPPSGLLSVQRFLRQPALRN